MTLSSDPFTQSKQRSNVCYQIARANAEGFGNPQKRVKTDPLFASLDFAHINWM